MQLKPPRLSGLQPSLHQYNMKILFDEFSFHTSIYSPKYLIFFKTSTTSVNWLILNNMMKTKNTKENDRQRYHVLQDGQGIHICPQRHHRLPLANLGHHPGAAGAQHRPGGAGGALAGVLAPTWQNERLEDFVQRTRGWKSRFVSLVFYWCWS